MSEPKKPEEVELTVMKPPPPSSADSSNSPVDSEDEDSAEQPAAKAQDFRFMDPERYLIEIIQHVQDDDADMVEDETGEVDDKSSSSEKPSDEEPADEKPSDEKPSEEKPPEKKTSGEEASDE
uniref:Uncharacterized protein n=1 Tax=Bionectria ochroleuca TaxID=29856 RepID=A0A8H7N2Z5_BIOOC